METINSNEGRKVGEFNTITKDFEAKRHGNQHMLKQPPSWALDAQVIETLRLQGCKTITVFDIDSRKVYMTTFDRFIEKAIKFNRGFGEQYALPIEYWTVAG